MTESIYENGSAGGALLRKLRPFATVLSIILLTVYLEMETVLGWVTPEFRSLYQQVFTQIPIMIVGVMMATWWGGANQGDTIKISWQWTVYALSSAIIVAAFLFGVVYFVSQ